MLDALGRVDLECVRDLHHQRESEPKQVAPLLPGAVTGTTLTATCRGMSTPTHQDRRSPYG
jgi:hypothetical protein